MLIKLIHVRSVIDCENPATKEPEQNTPWHILKWLQLAQQYQIHL